MSDETQIENIQEDPNPEEIERATRQGWSDKDDWKGDPEKWVDAKTFLQRGEDTLPILRANYKKLEDQFSTLQSERAKDKKVMEDFVKFQKDAEERMYKQALNDIRRQKAEAFDRGDKEVFDRMEKEEDKLFDTRIKQETKKESEESSEHPDWKHWLQENAWYKENDEAGAYADFIAPRIAANNPHLQGRALFNEVKDRVKKAMPQHFENPNRQRAAAVEGSNGGKRKLNGKTYSDLPLEAKKACDDFIARIPGYTKEQYVKDFDWSSIQ